MEDLQLLREYAERRSERAFTELVSRHTDFVYSTALRLVNESQLAEDVTQMVFIRLARKAASLGNRTVVTGWLYRTTQFVAQTARRSDWRRRKREGLAMQYSELNRDSASVWKDLAPLIEEAMGQLRQADQDAVLLRFFAGKSLREVGAALGISDDTAQKHVSRAIDRMRDYFARRGVVVSAALLGSTLAVHTVQAAPLYLAATLAATVTISTKTSLGFATSIKLFQAMLMAKLKAHGVGVVVAAMPIALHPDTLIAVILPASAYPLEIVQAARFVKDTNNIAKVDEQPWDENVKAVAKFPEMIAKLDADLAWTISLGQAFVNQPKALMDTIQALRSKAQKAGNLKTTPQQIVTVTNVVVLQTNVTEVVQVTKEIIEVVPANPSVVYVPSYPPTIYYPWYPYYAYPAPVCAFGVGFAWGMVWGAAWSHCNWHGGSVDIDIDSNRNVNRNTDRNTARASDRMNNTGGRGGSGRQQWKPDQNRMQRSGASPSTREARGWGSGGARPSTGNLGSRPSTGNIGARPSTGSVGARPSTGNVGARPSTGNVGARPATSPSRPQSSGTSAFNRSGGGSSTWSSSNRGTSSRGGGGFSRGGGGGRGGGGRR